MELSMISDSTFSNQSSLPNLPVPKLEQTLVKLKQSLVPFCSTEDEVRKMTSLVNDFGKGGLGTELQKRLQNFAEEETRKTGNWLDSMWLRVAYHTWRSPLIVNSNWFMVFKDHPQQPANLLHPKLPMVSRGHVTPFQIYRAAGLITAALNMKEEIEHGTIPPEYMGKNKTPLCMNQFKLMFGWTRRPLPECDENVCPGGFPSKSKHITVLFRDQIYSLQCYTEQPHQRLCIADLIDQLWHLVNEVMNRSTQQPPIGIMTADDRDSWAKARAHLLGISALNVASMEEIESSLFCLCLDDWSGPDDYDFAYRSMAHSFDGHNRWFDKAISISVLSNGQAGMNGEHSPCDALIPSRLMDYLVESEPVSDPVHVAPRTQMRKPKLLKWKVDEEIREAIEHAEVVAKSIAVDSDAAVLIFDLYGSDFIKRIARVSPDAYVQMVVQLAYYRLHDKWTATYETGSTRAFYHGRTDTIRTCSTDVVDFLQKMDSKSGCSSQERYQAFRKACDSHSKYTREVMAGTGIDRHLLALKMFMKSSESHPLFELPAFKEATTFRLSTSSLSSGENYNGTGFGAGTSDGYGLNYCIGRNCIKFGLESKKCDRLTSSRKFRSSLIHTFIDLRDLCKKVESSKM